MENKKRIFYLDFIRAVATILIVLTHYNALYVYNVYAPQNAVITLFPAGIYIGNLGVGLFMLISGAALYQTYGNREKVDWKAFYKKRFLTLYPTFWIAYIIVFLYQLLRFSYIPSLSPWRMIFSFLGIDGLISNYGVSTFYLVGEWFLGFIIIIYLLFPLLLWGIKKHEFTTIGIALVVCIVVNALFNGQPWISVQPCFWLPEIIFGMVYQKHMKKNIPWYVFCISIAVCLINTNDFMRKVPVVIQTFYICVSAFFILQFIAEKAEKSNLVCNITKIVCKYSYACFIIHHYVIYQIAGFFNLSTITPQQSVVIFIGSFGVVIVASILLQKISDFVMWAIRKIIALKKAEKLKQDVS